MTRIASALFGGLAALAVLSAWTGARAEQVQIDPAYNTVKCPSCSGGSGGGGSTANAADPTFTEGSTGNATSTDLHGYQRVNAKQSGTWNVAATSTVGSPTSTPTISTSAYVTGYVLGGIQSFTSQPTTGVIANANVTFNSGTFSGSVDLYLFNASPTGGGTADHAAFALTATDTAKLIGVLHLNDCSSLGGAVAQCQMVGQSQFYTLASSGTTIYAVAKVTGSPTFTGTSDAIFSLNGMK